jgi:hypothetical protein
MLGYLRVKEVFCESSELGYVWTLSPILAWQPNQILDFALNLFRQNH